jgi:hypothetical protein
MTATDQQPSSPLDVEALLTPAIVEVAAKAMFEVPATGDYNWEQMLQDDSSRADLWRDDARGVLTAVFSALAVADPAAEGETFTHTSQLPDELRQVAKKTLDQAMHQSTHWVEPDNEEGEPGGYKGGLTTMDIVDAVTPIIAAHFTHERETAIAEVIDWIESFANTRPKQKRTLQALGMARIKFAIRATATHHTDNEPN